MQYGATLTFIHKMREKNRDVYTFDTLNFFDKIDFYVSFNMTEKSLYIFFPPKGHTFHRHILY